MAFSSPKPQRKLDPSHRTAILKEYIESYRQIAQSNPEALRRKLKRSALEPLLERIGELLVNTSKQVADGEGGEMGEILRLFLQNNPMPKSLESALPPELRIYALLINGLKQWSVAQSLATDRWVISGNSRRTLRECTTQCVVTGENLDTEKIELHHPCRDGRPPIPVSKKGHAIADAVFSPEDDFSRHLMAKRKERNRSWKIIWQGCVLEGGEDLDLKNWSPNRSTQAKSTARRFARETGASLEEIRNWIEENQLVELA